VLKDVGGGGQQKLSAARVLVVGAGGLGVPVLAYLAGAGVGTIGIVDPDTISVSNLARQIVYRDTDIGHFKAERAVVVHTHRKELTADNGEAIVRDYDLIVEGTDSFATKRLVAEIAARHKIPVCMGALGPFDGTITTLAPYLGDERGSYPGFDTLYPTAPSPEESPPCELAGVLNVLPGIVGTMLANEAIKWITGFAPPLLGKLLIYSARTGQTRVMDYRV
jgi:molybdopterin-synthase adenylyltransferase